MSLPLRVPLPAVLGIPGFRLYWLGVLFSSIGTRATVAATLWQVFQLSGSTFQVGLVGLFDALALFVLSPLGGVVADRMDRRRLLQATQATCGLVGGGLTVLTLAGAIEPWHVYLAVLLVSAAGSFDQPARQALVPSIVPREHLVQAFALNNPTREFAVLCGPAVAGLLIAAFSPAAVYLFDLLTYATLVGVLALLHVPPLPPAGLRASIWASLGEGVAFVRRQPIVLQLITLDLSATLFGAYRVFLPLLAQDILHVGPQGYGLLASTPAAGALVGSALAYRLSQHTALGKVVLGATMAYGVAAVALAQSTAVWFALLAAAALGLCDALAAVVRQTAVQYETPDHLRGRVTSLYVMAGRGGPAVGQTVVGSLGALVGGPIALTLGGLVPIAYGGLLAVRGRRIRDYQGVRVHPAKA